MQIEIWFLVVSLIFPRLAILGAYFWGGMPAHVGIPFWLCFLMSIFCARILVTIFVGMNLGYNNIWFILHLTFCVLGTLFEFSKGATKTSKFDAAKVSKRS